MATASKTAQKPAEEAQDAPKPKKSKKKLVLFLMIFLVLAGAGGGAAWFFMGGEETALPEGAEGAVAQKPASKKEVKPPVFMVIEPFTVNLQPDGGGEQFLQIAFSLQVADQQTVDLIKLYMPQVRSRLLLLLSGKRSSQISTPDGKNKLADEIIETVKKPLAPGQQPTQVTNVFFTSFVIQ